MGCSRTCQQPGVSLNSFFPKASPAVALSHDSGAKGPCHCPGDPARAALCPGLGMWRQKQAPGTAERLKTQLMVVSSLLRLRVPEELQHSQLPKSRVLCHCCTATGQRDLSSPGMHGAGHTQTLVQQDKT